MRATRHAGAEDVSDGAAPGLGCGAVDAGLLAYWPLDEGVGTAIADCSGHGLDGTLFGSGTWVPGRKPTTKAIRFDETLATYVNVPASALADAATTITLAAWVSLGPGFNSYPIHKGQPPTMAWSLEMEDDDSASLYVSTNGTAYTLANVPGGPTATWFHFAAVYEPNKTQTLYINGVSVKSVAASPSMYQGSVSMKIGWHTRGSIDEVRVFSRALSAAEIAALASE